ncbi:MAG TPA: nuclear transport factor 2 family protein [Sphingobium sp.]|nr:nuclear transport factor 2 family protein [Sphingobium sp.]
MESADLARRLDRIESSLSIQQLPARYAMAVDSRNLDALAALYVDDVDYGEAGKGHEVLKQQFTLNLRLFYRSVHQILGHTFEFIDDDHATGRVYCRAEHERGDTWIVALMCYFDNYVRRDGKWLFAGKREYDFFYCADMLEHPQDPDFKRWVLPGLQLNPPMMLPRFPSWAEFWERQGTEVVSNLTAHP